MTTLTFFHSHTDSILCNTKQSNTTTMAKPKLLSLLTLSLLTLHFSLLHSSPNPDDTSALLSFKSSTTDPSNKLSTWTNNATPCEWYGISCTNNRVTRLVLENLDLRVTTFQPLTALTHLRVLSLKQNHISGPIPDLSNLTSLRLLFLSRNNFSGDFPASVLSLSKLYRLDLSYNELAGNIPAGVNRLTRLLTLRVEGNLFSGSISGLDLRNLEDFNVSGNLLVGEIPKSLSRFPVSAFGNNRVLCGSPLPKCKSIVTDPTRPGSDGAIASPLPPSNITPVVTSSPSTIPVTISPKKSLEKRHSSSNKLSTLALIGIILGDVLVLAVISIIIYCFCRKNMKRGTKRSSLLEGEKIIYSTSPYRVYNGGAAREGGLERGQMVFFEGVKRFELEDLLRASAEMLGKGCFGTAYKAILDDGNVVAVKRLKEANFGGKREFEQHMEVLGRLKHGNVVSMKAYYFARDEKLLVYEYMPNGSLFWLLHGNRGPGRTPLDWTTRLKIAAGASRGLSFIHNSCKSLKLTHGNIKSTNILLDKTGNARVSDFGLSIFTPPSTTPTPRSNGYRAPEQSDGRKPTQKADVYSFGVLLLELLTGKCPSAMDDIGPIGPGDGYGGPIDLPRWVQSVVREEWTAEVFDLELMRYKGIEEEMVGLLQIALACTSPTPDERPKIGYVVKMIEGIRGVEASPSNDTCDSVSESPSMSEDTCRASE